MNPEQKQTDEKVDREFKKADAALELISTPEAKTRRDVLKAKYSNVRNAVTESERADFNAREARGKKKEADQKLANVVDAVSTVVSAARGSSPVPAVVSDGSPSASETAEQLIKGLVDVPDSGMLVKALEISVEHSNTVQADADRKQFEAERNVYVAHSEFFTNLHETHGFIKLNTEVDSLARQRLKQQRKARRKQTVDATQAKADETAPVAPKADEEKAS